MEPDGMRVGVAALAEWLRLTAGGGPIAPSRVRFDVLAPRALMGPLARTLLPRADFVSVEGVWLSRRSLMLSVSDRAEGGRVPTTLGVAKMEDSRRLAGILAADAGVPPAVPRTVMRLLS